jgi:hypothetical protein
MKFPCNIHTITWFSSQCHYNVLTNTFRNIKEQIAYFHYKLSVFVGIINGIICFSIIIYKVKNKSRMHVLTLKCNCSGWWRRNWSCGEESTTRQTDRYVSLRKLTGSNRNLRECLFLLHPPQTEVGLAPASGHHACSQFLVILQAYWLAFE